MRQWSCNTVVDCCVQLVNKSLCPHGWRSGRARGHHGLARFLRGRRTATSLVVRAPAGVVASYGGLVDAVDSTKSIAPSSLSALLGSSDADGCKAATRAVPSLGRECEAVMPRAKVFAKEARRWHEPGHRLVRLRRGRLRHGLPR